MWILDKKDIQYILFTNPLEFFYDCIHYGSLRTLKYFLSFNIDLTYVDLPTILKFCLEQRLLGLDKLKCFFNHHQVTSLVADICFMPNGQSFLSTVIVSAKDEQQALLFLEYFVTDLKLPSHLTDKSPNPLTPLHWACNKGYLSVVQWLVETQKVSPDDCPKGLSYPLNMAIMGNHLEVAQYLIEKQGQSPTLSDQTREAYAPLHWACERGSLSLVRYLIEKQKIPPRLFSTRKSYSSESSL